MGALADPVPVLIDLDVGSHFLHLLDQVEGLLVDDRRVMVFLIRQMLTKNPTSYILLTSFVFGQ